MLSDLKKTELQQLVHNCYDQKDMNKKIETLYKINSMLPKSLQLKKIPSLLTDDYIDKLLYRIEQNLRQLNNSVWIAICLVSLSCRIIKKKKIQQPASKQGNQIR